MRAASPETDVPVHMSLNDDHSTPEENRPRRATFLRLSVAYVTFLLLIGIGVILLKYVVGVLVHGTVSGYPLMPKDTLALGVDAGVGLVWAIWDWHRGKKDPTVDPWGELFDRFGKRECR